MRNKKNTNGQKKKYALEFDLVLIPDQNLGGYSGYFLQFPNVFADGEDEKEVFQNLINALHDIWVWESEKQAKEIGKYGHQVIRKSMSLQESA